MDSEESEEWLGGREDAAVTESIDRGLSALVSLAAKLCGAPVAALGVVEAGQEKLLARFGTAVSQLPSEHSPTRLALAASGFFSLENIHMDPNFARHPVLAEEPTCTHYSAFPVRAGAEPIGALWVMHTAAEPLSAEAQQSLSVLAGQASLLLRLRERSATESFFQRSIDLLCVANSEGYFVRLNPVWESVLGFSLDELKSRPFLDFVHPDDVEATMAEASRVARGHETISFEDRFRTTSGDYRRLHWTAAPAPDGEHLYAIARDITEASDNEVALRESRARLEALFEATVDTIITIDERGTMLTVNPAGTRLFGYTLAEMVGSNVSMLMPREHREKHDGYLKRYQETHDRHIIGKGRDLVGRRKDGTTFPLYLAVNEMAKSGPVEFVGIIHDTSKEVAATEKLQHQSRLLEQSSQQAMAASRLKSEFLANMSHELRTPLNGIMGFSKLLGDGEVGPVTEQQKEFLGLVLSSAQHLLQLINDILDISKVEAGALEFRPEEIEFSKIVEEITSVVRELAAKKRLRLETDLAPECNALFLDPARLKQVLYNYLSNAIKFTPEEGTVTIRTRPEGEHHVRIEVIDTGIGIAAEDIPKLFQEFTQLDQGSEERHQGTGLGLALTKRLVEAKEGGSVGLSSKVGVGSTFFAVMPLRDNYALASDHKPQPPSAQRHQGASEQALASSLKLAGQILVVEDDSKDRAWLRRVLGDAGYVVHTAATGVEAIRLATEEAFDVVTLDMFLPDMTGLDVLAALRELPLHRATPAIVVTVLADEGVVAGYHISDFLSKPARPEDLLAAVARAGVENGSLPILIVDDDPAAVAVASTALRKIGIAVKTAGNGAVALQIANEGPLAAVILDLMMPVLDGFGFLEEFRAEAGHAATPVIVWSSKDISADERQRLKASAQAIVLKGADAANDLLHAVQVQLGEVQ